MIAEANSDGKLEENPYLVNNMYGDLFEMYLSFKAILETKMESFTASLHDSNSESSLDGSSSSRQNNLPNPSLPTFSGQYEDWNSFKDRFESMVGSRTNLPLVDKLQYLNNCLKGEAA